MKKTDLDHLQGAWTIVSLEIEKQAMAPEMLAGASIVVKGRTFTTVGMGATYNGTVAIDTTKAPKTIDLTFTTGPQKGTINPGIYELDGETWRLCLQTRGQDRPARFATKAGTGLALETLTRAGAKAAVRKAPTTTSAKPSPATPASTSTAPSTEIEGEWAMVSHVKDGKAMDAGMVKYCRRVTHGDETTVLAATQVMMRARFALDPSAAPKRIDYFAAGKASTTPTQLGVYTLSGDRLTICMADAGAPRPKDTRAGGGRLVTEWARIKA